MKNSCDQNRAAFTLVEIMIVVAIIGLLATLATPGMMKARKQAQGRRIVQDVRQMDGAIDQWALEKGKTNGATIVTAEVSEYLKPNSWDTNDILGNAWVVTTVGTNQIRISAATKSALSGAGIDWGAY